MRFTKPDKPVEDGDRYNYELWFTYILGSWLSFYEHYKRPGGCMASRRGVENIIGLAFRHRKHQWRYVFVSLF